MEGLIYGELSAMHFATTGDTSDIKDKELKKMIAFTNDALTDVYTKIPMSIKTCVIDSQDNIAEYRLTKEHALTFDNDEEGNETVKYIRDSKEHPFTGEVLKILEVRDELGRRIPLNDEAFDGGVFTPYPNVLLITHPSKEKSYEVTYTAKPARIVWKQRRLEIAEQIVEIPVQLEEALLAKIASRFFVGMSGQEVSQKYMELVQRYEQAVENYKSNNLIDTTRLSDTHRFCCRGYI